VEHLILHDLLGIHHCLENMADLELVGGAVCGAAAVRTGAEFTGKEGTLVDVRRDLAALKRSLQSVVDAPPPSNAVALSAVLDPSVSRVLPADPVTPKEANPQEHGGTSENLSVSNASPKKDEVMNPLPRIQCVPPECGADLLCNSHADPEILGRSDALSAGSSSTLGRLEMAALQRVAGDRLQADNGVKDSSISGHHTGQCGVSPLHHTQASMASSTASVAQGCPQSHVQSIRFEPFGCVLDERSGPAVMGGCSTTIGGGGSLSSSASTFPTLKMEILQEAVDLPDESSLSNPSWLHRSVTPRRSAIHAPVGSTMQLTGLLKQAHLNEEMVRVVGVDSQTGVYQIELNDGTMKTIYEDNLRMVFDAGAVVQLHSLVNLPNLNGQLAVVMSSDQQAFTYSIKLEDGCAKTIRRDNLTFIDSGLSRPASLPPRITAPSAPASNLDPEMETALCLKECGACGVHLCKRSGGWRHTLPPIVVPTPPAMSTSLSSTVRSVVAFKVAGEIAMSIPSGFPAQEESSSLGEGLGHTAYFQEQFGGKLPAEYVGALQGGCRHGFGRQAWPDGSFYEGSWSEGDAHGLGVFTAISGNVYIGQWNRGLAHGLGSFTWASGAVYRGRFLADQCNGEGVLEGGSGPGTLYAGSFRDGGMDGLGTFKWADDSIYHGTWRSNSVEGAGSYQGQDGRRFRGLWKKDLMHGLGEYTWPSGRRYRGGYEENKRHGIGIDIGSDGRHFVGWFELDRRHGVGRLTSKDGATVKHGVWKEGRSGFAHTDGWRSSI